MNKKNNIFAISSKITKENIAIEMITKLNIILNTLSEKKEII